MRARAPLALGGVLLAMAAAPAGALGSSLKASWAPVVLTGTKLGKPLEGISPGRLVAFRRTDAGRWLQVPVQVDQRLEVDFGSTTFGAGSMGTVYGTPPVGTTALQYADPNTFVGADPDPTLDANDEVAVMAADAGGKASSHVSAPAHVASASARRLRIVDPVGGGKGFIYLYRSDGKLDPSAGRDYVRYDFNLTSGDYRSTYRRAAGPNPETSRVTTSRYRIGFADRWLYDSLTIRGPGAGGADILDGYKFGFAPGNCGRSEATFDAAEGAFVANVDGPVRAIRSYVGANSGPYTERTHFFYRDADQIVTDLRVHPITGLWIYHDMAEPAIGMTYRDSTHPAGVTVDGVDDPGVGGGAPPDWHMWSGSQGTLFAADRFQSSFDATLRAGASGWYLDDATPPYQQCWGDSEALGQAGYLTTASIPSTDPHIGGTDSLRSTTTEVLAGGGTPIADARRWSSQIDTPLRTRVSAGSARD